MSQRTIKVNHLARVEGEGALYVKIKGRQVETVKLEIFEPPRFFEALLRDRCYTEAPDITSRICGICPVAYQMSACHALEHLCATAMPEPIRALRRLLYCGEWIESHCLHIYMLHAPDFLGYESVVHMAKDYADEVQRGLRLKKAGNAIVELLGGREIHPINVKLGGFYRAPTRNELNDLRQTLNEACDAAEATVRWTSSFSFPAFEQDYEFVSLTHPNEYPFNEGTLVSNKGLEIPVAEYEDHFEEEQVPHSTALHARRKGYGNYLVGPMARFHNNRDKLSKRAQAITKEIDLEHPCRNPFKSIVIRSIEVLYALEEALRIVEAYHQPPESFVPIHPRAGTGIGCTEAPRGILVHRYKLDKNGNIQDAKIVPPTSQNQGTIESDLRRLIPQYLDAEQDELQWKCEQAIRNYDPCISCATHFLKLHMEGP